MKGSNYLHTGWLAIAGACLATGSAAGAARQGELGDTSTGSVTISVSVAPRARISGLQDIDLGLGDPGAGARRERDVCVWSNASAGSYTLTAAGSGPGGAFQLSSGQQTVGYSVEWSASAGQSSGEALTGGATRTNLQTSATNADCADGSASLVVTLEPAQLASAERGAAYTGVLTLMVAPK